jgi:hypothetical protein
MMAALVGHAANKIEDLHGGGKRPVSAVAAFAGWQRTVEISPCFDSYHPESAGRRPRRALPAASMCAGRPAACCTAT